MRIAIIGGGIAGLTAAYRLHGRHEVTLFEANDYVGGHTNTVRVSTPTGSVAVDTGFIVLNDATYPNFRQLLSELQVATRPTSMSFSVRCDRTGLEYRGADWNGLFAQRRNLLNPQHYRLLYDIVRFNREASDVYARSNDDTTVGEFFAEAGYSPSFFEQYFLPMGSAIWSCPRTTFADFPLRFVIEFYRHHGLLSLRRRPQWYVVDGGSQTYVRAMTGQFADRIRLAHPVRRVRRLAQHVKLDVRGEAWDFDHVIFACHSDQALRILGDGATPVERELLGAIPYERNVAVLHTDTRVLPRTRRAWASWNYHLPAAPDGKATVTYNMNILQHLPTDEVYCVTLNGQDRIDPAKVIRSFVYHHPVFTSERSAVHRRHAELLNRGRTSFCGAYWGNGFHEDGVNSALAVCAALEREEPCVVASTKVGFGISG